MERILSSKEPQLGFGKLRCLGDARLSWDDGGISCLSPRDDENGKDCAAKKHMKSKSGHFFRESETLGRLVNTPQHGVMPSRSASKRLRGHRRPYYLILEACAVKSWRLKGIRTGLPDFTLQGHRVAKGDMCLVRLRRHMLGISAPA